MRTDKYEQEEKGDWKESVDRAIREVEGDSAIRRGVKKNSGSER